jgi:hypothetical protein
VFNSTVTTAQTHSPRLVNWEFETAKNANNSLQKSKKFKLSHIEKWVMFGCGVAKNTHRQREQFNR